MDNSTKLKRVNVRSLAQYAILAAIIVILSFTPLGYLKVGTIEITFIIIPVAVGAVVLGPVGGAVLGGVFGITSFIQCFTGSLFGGFLLGLNPVLTFVTCLIPRVLCGCLAGLLFKALAKKGKDGMLPYAAAGVATPLLNTLFFILSIVLFFWKNEAFISQMGSWGITTDNVWVFFIAFVGLNGLVEAIVGAIVGSAVSKGVMSFLKKSHTV